MKYKKLEYAMQLKVCNLPADIRETEEKKQLEILRECNNEIEVKINSILAEQMRRK